MIPKIPQMLFKQRWLSCLFSTALCLAISPAWAADTIRFQLDWLPGGDKAPVYVGIEQGFFAAEGLDVKVFSGRGSNDAIGKIASGNADIGLSDIVALLLARAQADVPVTAIYSVFSQAPHAFFVLEDSPVTSVNDLAGKRVSTSAFTSSNIFFPLLLKKNHVDPTSVALIKTDPGALNPMLLTGNTDVVISWITDFENYSRQANDAGKRLRIMPWYDAGLEFYSTSVIASDRWLQDNPDLARRFLRAFAKSIQFTWQHPDEAAEAVHKAVPEVAVVSAAATIRSIKGLVYNQASAATGMGFYDSERLATTWRWTALAEGLEDKQFDPVTALNQSFIASEKE
jgi:NitT/TauT family transport system substrate-binding protein|tara:strand:- start:3047 stop:4072 length:1026 start_codon:yes stop_codon:yes gene_type:complete